MKEEIVEILADVEHDRWASWQAYLFSKCSECAGIKCINDDYKGHLVIPRWAVERWRRQIATKYVDLSEDEKESDRKEARTTVKALEDAGYVIVKSDSWERIHSFYRVNGDRSKWEDENGKIDWKDK